MARGERRFKDHGMSIRFKDFEISRREVYVRTTGARVPIDWANTKDTLNWYSFYLIYKMLSLPRRILGPRIAVHSVPAKPRAWYLLWAAGHGAGVDFTAPIERADAILYFEDQTQVSEHRALASALPAINRDCTDISKSKVANIFKSVFGYDLCVDPSTYDGPMVVKSEENGAHDGHIINGPCVAKPGWVYQRVIDNRSGEYVTDLRCPSVGGDIPLIYIKQRPVNTRFANMNSHCTLARTDDHLSASEQLQLKAFAKAMHLDWGGMDVLRDNVDGRIYVVDVNKTDMGPPLALSLVGKIRSVNIMAKALRGHLRPAQDKMKPLQKLQDRLESVKDPL